MDERVKGVIKSAIVEFGEQANLASDVTLERMTTRILHNLEEQGFLVVPAAQSGPFLRKIVDHDLSVQGSHGCGTGG
jgi:hypothetical protein